MKIQFLNGGLANQAFQYIFARYYELSHPGKIMYLDDSYFALNTVHNGYELDKIFSNIHTHMLSGLYDSDTWNYILEERGKGKSVPQILSENKISIYMISEVDGYANFNPFSGMVVPLPAANQYLPEILEMPGNAYYHGYWINLHWFKTFRQDFLHEFTFPAITDSQNKEWEQKIKTSKSVSIHIRRGDYVSLGWAMETDNYRQLTDRFLQEMSNDWEVFVFSDDIPWCRENKVQMGLDRFKEVHFIEGNTHGKNYVDMQLMSQCKAMMLSNSAFCYLAALLNTEKQFVVKPTPREI